MVVRSIGRIDNAVTKRKGTKRQNGRKTLHRKSKVEHSEPHKKKLG
jgi:hypothetical protein